MSSRLVLSRTALTVRLAFPMRTTNPNNGSQGASRGAMFARARERKMQRTQAAFFVGAARPMPPVPVQVTITRVAPSSGLDPHDGLGAALKGVIDGVADALGLRNDRDPRVTWTLAQRRGAAGFYGIEIEVTTMATTTTEDRS